ncbi:ferritin-like domain-containing protein [Pyxidicoccus xibeiensis]|uniref:ferritin-like domain-containing protein n=1 Tax=Pyxidicoccus xibeiensis TaxID=2906759 RepID=UPI0020A7F7BA|nr:ferritin-like domain-containing protein [Pyxidicoccus xibeiensis]MCP3144489.1 ferritin-like domain-containing protein [Pyxidicoccus xibeiensis]
MNDSPSEPLADPVRRLVAEAWTFRRQVELDAALRFARLTEQLAQLGAPEALVSLAQRAAEDERRHAGMCELLARTYGQVDMPPVPLAVEEVAPPGMGFRERVLYEVVAACCITETESTAVLTTLLVPDATPRVRAVLRDILRDEVAHARLGWAWLAREHAEGAVAFLAGHVPSMLEGSVSPRLFAAGGPEEESPALMKHGVLPHTRKRETFVRALRDVVFPGLERFGVNTGPGRSWVERRSAAGA